MPAVSLHQISAQNPHQLCLAKQLAGHNWYMRIQPKRSKVQWLYMNIYIRILPENVNIIPSGKEEAAQLLLHCSEWEFAKFSLYHKAAAYKTTSVINAFHKSSTTNKL